MSGIRMNIAILQRDLDELQSSPVLFDALNFQARKEALDFVRVIGKLHTEDHQTSPERVRLFQQAQALGEQLEATNAALFHDWKIRIKNQPPSREKLRQWLQPYTNYAPHQWGISHYGYENLDFLLDGVLLPQPQPQANLPREYGMVRYEPAPASVILELTERVAFTDNDVFYDLGSGLGKVTALMHLLTGVRCVGVEYQPAFCAYARQQAAALQLINADYIQADARVADYADGTVFFLFNPFGGDIFATVLERLRQEAQQREILICSYGACTQPLAGLNWLERIPPVGDDDFSLAIFTPR